MLLRGEPLYNGERNEGQCRPVRERSGDSLNAVIATKHPQVGNGIDFIDMAPNERLRLSEYLQSAYWRVTRNPNRATTSVHSPTPLQLLNSSKFRASEHLPRHRISGLFNASLSMPRHTSCPYCIEGLGFKVMTPCNGDFVCSSCGHRVSLHCPTFNCSCPKCNDTDRREIEIPARWS
jgi:hypothetical protein